MLNFAVYLPFSYTSSNPSIRLRRLALRSILKKQGIHCEVIHHFDDLWKFTNIQISCFGDEALKQVKILKNQGKRLFFDHSENLLLPGQKEVFDLCDVIVCCSTKLAEITRTYTNPRTQVIVIPDIIENYESLPLHTPKPTEKLKVSLCGMGGNAFLGKELEPLIKEIGGELVTINEWPDATVKFDLDTYNQEIVKCDIAICPQKVDQQPAKSNVKFTQSLALGMPTICSPLPAYLEVAEHNKNCLVANTTEEWRAAFQQLTSLEERLKLSIASKVSVKDYTPDAIGKRWFRLLREEPKVKIALINNTLVDRYASYGDYWLEAFRQSHCEVDVFKYEDIENLPNKGYNFYFFVEIRYFPEKINKNDNYLSCRPRLLYTQEAPTLNELPHFDVLITPHQQVYDYWNHRGFVNCELVENSNHLQQVDKILSFVNKDYTDRRIQHNLTLHSQHIDSFSYLLYPEQRWDSDPDGRDGQHISYTLKNLKDFNCKNVLDIGSADGFLSLRIAKESIPTSALEFVDRGIAWTKEQATRLGLTVDLRKGAIENVVEVFNDKTFDAILLYEILEHLSVLTVSNHIINISKILNKHGIILISLPSQDVQDNLEHLYSPSEYLIKRILEDLHHKTKGMFTQTIEWKSLVNHGIPGNWFIRLVKMHD